MTMFTSVPVRGRTPLRLNSVRSCLAAMVCVCVSLNCLAVAVVAQQEEQIPHNQSKPPGPALTPEQAIAKMEVPAGFRVEVVASEPDIVNPVAMTFDERGRVWITESLEYPRLSAGPGRDRIRILEDTDHDGRMDKFTVFAEGLNIPSGIAVGHGGVWVANSPDILFLKDTDGDDRADTSEVVVTGFGRFDTHELPNSLTWGPDGCLYGLNGVFNRSVVKDPVTGRTFDFTCALFRINPRTHQFDLFAEGTSNPWGVAWNPRGEPFLSACVIDHLWHLTETGYYHRQGGPYPPFTWKAESIVSHKHQKAAYCGIHYFDSDAYPEAYRDRLMMGNIHGNCINVDVLHDREATYHATPDEDFLTANDVWFMPVVQKTGPDGCLWVLDWYDRYHCYQDARRDPEGIDRLKGRLYRIRYEQSPRATAFDLSKETDEQLIARLSSPNIFFRDLAQRILAERNHPQANEALESLALSESAALKVRLHALWARIGADSVTDGFLLRLLSDADPDVRAWGVRVAGNQQSGHSDVVETVASLSHDPHPRVRVQVAVAAVKMPAVTTIPVLVEVLVNSSDDDPLTRRIVWQNLQPLLENQSAEFLTAVAAVPDASLNVAVLEVLPLAMDRMLSVPRPDTRIVAQLIATLLSAPGGQFFADPAFRFLTQRIRSRELTGDSLEEVRRALEPKLMQPTVVGASNLESLAAVELAASLGIPAAVDRAVEILRSTSSDDARALCLNAIVNSGDPRSLAVAVELLHAGGTIVSQRHAVQGIGRIATADATATLIRDLATLPAEVQPVAIESLTNRVESSMQLLQAVRDGKVSGSLINANQARKMLQLNNPQLSALLEDHWGTVRADRDPARARLISQMRRVVRSEPGDAVSGHVVFKRVCGQCHKIYGEGAEVGPDITRNGRASLEQLLSNVFDPSLVIGAAYQASTVVTTDGRVVTGLLAEDSPQRVVLKVQGDKRETIARTEIEELVRSQLSLMPEGLEKQVNAREMRDLLAFLVLDRPPTNSDAAPLPGVVIPSAQTSQVSDFAALVDQILPGFAVMQSGEGGVALISDHRGRPALRTHPVSRRDACQVTGTVNVPETSRPVMMVSVASHENADWLLQVLVNGKRIHESLITPSGDEGAWHDLEIDLSAFSGQTVKVELRNQSINWNNEFGYWNGIEVFPE